MPAARMRSAARISEVIGTDLCKVKPGSEAAMRLKAHLIEHKAWSQYLEVGIGPDAEVFTKCPPMASVGTGSAIGVRGGFLLEQPRARAGARGQRARPDRRRDARQRRQSARRRGPQRAAARQGQGQQRLLGDRAVHPPARRALRPRAAARHHHQPRGQRQRRLRARRHELDERDQPRRHRPGRPDASAPITSIRTA